MKLKSSPLSCVFLTLISDKRTITSNENFEALKKILPLSTTLVFSNKLFTGVSVNWKIKWVFEEVLY